MAVAHPGLNSLKKYLKTRFAWKQDWYCEVTGETFTWKQVSDALYRLKSEAPAEAYQLLCYCWLTHRSRNEIADFLHLDPSTLKRGADRLLHSLKMYLSHPELYSFIDEVAFSGLEEQVYCSSEENNPSFFCEEDEDDV